MRCVVSLALWAERCSGRRARPRSPELKCSCARDSRRVPPSIQRTGELLVRQQQELERVRQLIASLSAENDSIRAEQERLAASSAAGEEVAASLRSKLDEDKSCLEALRNENQRLEEEVAKQQADLAQVEVEARASREAMGAERQASQAAIEEMRIRFDMQRQAAIADANRSRRLLARLKRSRWWFITAPLRVGTTLMREFSRRVRFWKPLPAGATPLLSFLRPSAIRDARAIRRGGLFDDDFYLHRYPDVEDTHQLPLVQYVVTGARERRQPHPLFDSSFYLERSPDVAASGDNPLRHYLLHGGFEGRDPHPLFDSSFYLERSPDVAASGDNPLCHYLLHGGFEGRDPHPLFDSSFYLERSPDVAASGDNPLCHYLLHGGFEGRDPHPLFDSSFYLGAVPRCCRFG